MKQERHWMAGTARMTGNPLLMTSSGTPASREKTVGDLPLRLIESVYSDSARACEYCLFKPLDSAEVVVSKNRTEEMRLGKVRFLEYCVGKVHIQKIGMVNSCAGQIGIP